MLHSALIWFPWTLVVLKKKYLSNDHISLYGELFFNNKYIGKDYFKYYEIYLTKNTF